MRLLMQQGGSKGCCSEPCLDGGYTRQRDCARRQIFMHESTKQSLFEQHYCLKHILWCSLQIQEGLLCVKMVLSSMGGATYVDVQACVYALQGLLGQQRAALPHAGAQEGCGGALIICGASCNSACPAEQATTLLQQHLSHVYGVQRLVCSDADRFDTFCSSTLGSQCLSQQYSDSAT